MVLKKKRNTSDVLIVDASKGFLKVGKSNQLRASDIKRIVDTVVERATQEKFSRVVTLDEIRANDYNLNIPRYVDSSEAAETWDLYAMMHGGIPRNEINAFGDLWECFPSLKAQLFTDPDLAYSTLRTSDVEEVIQSNQDVKDWKNDFSSAFADFPGFLAHVLIVQWASVNINRGETELANAIFDRLRGVALIDKYVAYQEFRDQWGGIAGDLEVLQTEGFESTTIVDPNMITKKKSGKEVEVQDGWIGRVLPFDLVQSTLLIEQSSALHQLENRLADILSEYEEILDALPQEDKDSEILNAANDAFAKPEVLKWIKASYGSVDKAKLEVTASDEDMLLRSLLRVHELSLEEKALKARIKKDAAYLEALTKETIEGLDDDQVRDLLGKKWITPLMSALHTLPDAVVADLTKKLKALTEKYSTTFGQVAQEIAETKSSLADLMDDLVADEFDSAAIQQFQKMLRG
jgi:type I restriction enzyme M protein